METKIRIFVFPSLILIILNLINSRSTSLGVLLYVHQVFSEERRVVISNVRDTLSIFREWKNDQWGFLLESSCDAKSWDPQDFRRTKKQEGKLMLPKIGNDVPYLFTWVSLIVPNLNTTNLFTIRTLWEWRIFQFPFVSTIMSSLVCHSTSPYGRGLSPQSRGCLVTVDTTWLAVPRASQRRSPFPPSGYSHGLALCHSSLHFGSLHHCGP